jgi:U6 snRNA-associated Sm-like protein LSm7
MSNNNPGRGSSGGRGGGGGRGNASAAASTSTNPKQQSILELGKMMDQMVRVKCIGGRELEGILKGYDDLVNLVLDDTDEYLRGE